MDLKNGAFLYIIGAVIALFVLVQSVYFLVRAIKHGRRIGLSTKAMKDATVSSATFSIVPSIPIVIAMIGLVSTLGAPFSWIRLSVIGSMTYETSAASAVVQAANVSGSIIPLDVFASAMFIMTIGIIAGPVFNIFGFKRYQKKIDDISKRNPRWSAILIDALFMGIIAVMGGQYIAKGIAAFGALAPDKYILNGQAQLFTLVSGALIMALFGAAIKLTKAKWLENFALPVSMIGAVALSVLYHGMFSGVN